MLMSFVTHDGDYVPKYVRKGGEGAQVREILDPEHANSPAIEVPPDVYSLIHWRNKEPGCRR
jgi:hypothetical protein